MKTITAKYPGKCKKTGARILAGDLINWYKGGAVLLRRGGGNINVITLMGDQGPKTYYQNARGRCIDAPCCGCCTI